MCSAINLSFWRRNLHVILSPWFAPLTTLTPTKLIFDETVLEQDWFVPFILAKDKVVFNFSEVFS